MIVEPASVPTNDAYRLLISVLVPRPIAWVSTRSAAGVSNLAPFSYFMGIASRPMLVGIAINEREGDPKDTLRNVRETGEFVINVVSTPLLDAMVRTAGEWPASVSEFGVAGVGEAPSLRVAPPAVAESPIHLECRLHREIPLGNSVLVVGEVLVLDVRDELLTDGRVDAGKLAPVGRLGGELYALPGEIVKRPRPRVSRATGEMLPPAGSKS